jgi:hypothetical protein
MFKLFALLCFLMVVILIFQLVNIGVVCLLLTRIDRMGHTFGDMIETLVDLRQRKQ